MSYAMYIVGVFFYYDINFINVQYLFLELHLGNYPCNRGINSNGPVLGICNYTVRLLFINASLLIESVFLRNERLNNF
jgi:hypothetical protein